MRTIKKKAYASKRQPEQEIVTLASKVSKIIAANRNVVVIAASVLAAVILVTAGLSFKRSLDEQKAAPLFEAAYSQYNPGPGSAPAPGKALDLFREIHTKYPSSMSGRMADLYAANCLADLGRNEEALKAYQSFVREYSGDKLMTGLAYQRMGYLDESLGKQADAIKAFQQTEVLTGPGIASIELARLYEASGNSAEAQKQYKLVAEKLPGSAWAMEAMAKVQKIQAVPATAGAKKQAAP